MKEILIISDSPTTITLSEHHEGLEITGLAISDEQLAVLQDLLLIWKYGLRPEESRETCD